MTTLYKLTDKNNQTYRGFQWKPGVIVKTSGEGGLCGPGFTHWYTHPLLAVLLNPIHAGFDLKTARLWEGEGVIVKTDHGLKVGCTEAKIIKQITIPKISTEQKVVFGILCALEVCKDPDFVKWANNWLSGKDRTARAAESAAAAAAAARAAARAAEAAARAARAAESAGAAWSARAAGAAWSARAAAAAAAAARAAEAANFDLIKIAEQATKE